MRVCVCVCVCCVCVCECVYIYVCVLHNYYYILNLLFTIIKFHKLYQKW